MGHGVTGSGSVASRYDRGVPHEFANLSTLFINTTLTRSPGMSHTQLLIDISASIMAKQGVSVDQFRAIDHPIATGVYPDMREHGWETDAWPDIYKQVLAADILVIAGPIWLGDNSTRPKKLSSGCTPTPVSLTRPANSLYTVGLAAVLLPATRMASSTVPPTCSTACSTSGTAFRRRPTPDGSARPGPAHYATLG